MGMVGRPTAAAVLGFALVLSSGTARATFPGTNGRIAFASFADENYDIFTMTPTGEDITRLTTSAGDERNPAWAPAGNRIAYDVDGYIHVMAADGSWDDRVATCYFDSQPAWSPDGTRHVFHRQYGKVGQLMVRNSDGTNEQNLHGTGTSQTTPDWSPDADEILFVNEQFLSENIVHSALWLVNSDGSDPRALTDSENGDLDPSWHPDSAQIAFASTLETEDLDIYVMNEDGSGRVRLTDHPASDYDPVWSPDGAKIAFVSNRDGDSDIFVMDADGSNVTKLTDNNVRRWIPRLADESDDRDPRRPG